MQCMHGWINKANSKIIIRIANTRINVIIGASLSEPHINGNALRD